MTVLSSVILGTRCCSSVVGTPSQKNVIGERVLVLTSGVNVISVPSQISISPIGLNLNRGIIVNSNIMESDTHFPFFAKNKYEIVFFGLGMLILSPFSPVISVHVVAPSVLLYHSISVAFV